MNRFAGLTTLSLCLALLTACSGRFVKKPELKYLNEKYTGDYMLIKQVDIGNNENLKPGLRVKVYFRSDSESVKVYIYKYNEPREQAIGKNVIYLFESDFPDEKYSRELLEKKVGEILEPAKAL